MDPELLQSATTATAQTIAVATTTVVTTMGRDGQYTGNHRVINVHGRLMYNEIVMNDVWINAILSTLAMSCAAGVCVCFLYCKFQQWKLSAQRRRNQKNARNNDDDSLPSYTMVTGLPTYDEAVERMNRLQSADKSDSAGEREKTDDARGKPATVVVQIKDDDAAPPKPDPKYGLVSHSLFAHDDGCSHCLSVQELLETYNVR